MKHIIALVALIAGLAFSAGAQASGSHWCRQGDPPIIASSHTSCPFAGEIINHYVWAGEKRLWRGRVRSPVTHKRYLITCRRTGSGPRWKQWVRCTGSNNIWTRFSADI